VDKRERDEHLGKKEREGYDLNLQDAIRVGHRGMGMGLMPVEPEPAERTNFL